MELVRMKSYFLNAEEVSSIRPLSRENGCMVTLKNGEKFRFPKTIEETAKELGIEIKSFASSKPAVSKSQENGKNKPEPARDPGGVASHRI